MIRHSLRLRLLGGAAIAIFAALVVSWFAMTWLFERHIDDRVVAELRRDALQLIGSLQIDADSKLLSAKATGDSRFETPASGLYWQLSNAAGQLRSRSLWEEVLPASSIAVGSDWTIRHIDGPFSQRLLLLERVIRPDQSGVSVLVQMAHDEKPLRDARDEFGRELSFFMMLLGLTLWLAAWVQVQLGLRPLARVSESLEALRRNSSARLGGDTPVEIEPLANAINALAEAREKELNAARRRAADLAHGLKTPLAALSAQSRRARESGAVEAADGLDRAIAAAASAVEAELTRIRAATIRNTAQSVDCAVRPVVERLIGVIEHTDRGATLMFDIDIPDEVRAPVAGEDLSEILGALMENSARFARRQVRVSTDTRVGVSILVEDDGPGLRAVSEQKVMMHDGRIDEIASSHGRGMSIARELAEASGGAIAIDEAPLGGLRVVVSWRPQLDKL